MATDDSTQFPPVGTPDSKLRAITARAHALLSVAQELDGYEAHLAGAVDQLANDIMDDAAWLDDRFREYNDAELAKRDAEPAADAEKAAGGAVVTSELVSLIEANKAASDAMHKASNEKESSRAKPSTAWLAAGASEDATLMALCSYRCRTLDEVRIRADYLANMSDAEHRLDEFKFIDALLRSSRDTATA